MKRKAVVIMKPDVPDFEIQNEGTVLVFNPLTDRAVKFAGDLGLEDWQWLGQRFVVDHRPGWALIEALKDEGFIVR